MVHLLLAQIQSFNRGQILDLLYFISPKGGPTFNVRYVYTTEASNNTQHRRFFYPS